MLISVIVPVYNAEKYLKECIDSVIEQTYTDIEILLVDDGSTDKSGDICEKYALQDNRIKVMHQKNEGQFSARISGVRRATGDYLVFLDADDKLRENAIGIIVDKVEKTDCDMLIFEGSRDSDFSSLYMDIPLEKDVIYQNEKLQYIYILALTTGKLNCMCMKAIKANLIKTDGDYSAFFRMRNGEDTLMALMAMDSAKKICYTDDSLYYYRKNEESVSKKYNPNAYEDYRELGCIRCEFSKKWFGKVEKTLYNRNLKICCDAIMHEITNNVNKLNLKCNKVKQILKDDFFINSYKMADRAHLSAQIRTILFLLLNLKMAFFITILYDVKKRMKGLFSK